MTTHFSRIERTGRTFKYRPKAIPFIGVALWGLYTGSDIVNPAASSFNSTLAWAGILPTGFPDGWGLQIFGLITGIFGAFVFLAICGASIAGWFMSASRDSVRVENEPSEALRRSEEKYRLLYNSIRDAIVVTDMQRQIVHCNAAFTELFGYTLAEIRGKSTRMLYENEQEYRKLGDALKDNIANPGFLYSTSYRKKNGEVFPGETNVYYLKDNITGYVGLIRDISPRKRAEQALRKSEALFRDLFESAPIGIFRTASTGRVLDLNPEMTHIMGFKDRQEALEYYTDVQHKFYADPGRRDEFLRLLKKTGKVEDFEFEARCPDGKRIWLNMNARIAQWMADGTFLIEGFVTDVSERIQAQQRVKQLNRVLRAISDVNQLIAKEKNPEQLIQDVGQLLVRSRGYSGAMLALTGQGQWQYATAGDTFGFVADSFEKGALPPCCFNAMENEGIQMISGQSEVCRSCRMVESRGTQDILSIRLKHADKTFGCMAVSLSPERGQDKEEKDLFVEVAEDISFALYTIEMETQALVADQARQNAEEQLRQAQKMEAVGRLAGGVAHDFNNMLNVILGYSSLSLAKTDENNPIYGFLQEIEQAAQRSAELTGQLLAFSRKQMVEPRILDLNETIEHHEKFLKRLIGEEIEIHFLPGPDLWAIRIDPTQIDQVLANLAVNSRDAINGSGGTVTIETENVTIGDSAEAGGHPEGDYVRLNFSDDGSGMEPDTLGRIFEPFFTTKKSGQGTGLGLSTVYGIVEQNDGFIDAESQPGKGTSIRIYFPRHEKVVAPETEGIENQDREGSETVLLVEDENQVLDLAKMILEDYGYTVLKARTPGEALALVREHDGPIDLLLTDVVMPEMNGRQLQQKVEDLQPGIRTIFMSGYTNDVISRRGLVDADVDFIKKPFSVELLTRKVREVLDS